MEKKMFPCDFGHDARIVKRLMTGGGSSIFVCYKHYRGEMNWRRYRNSACEDHYEMPAWEALKRVEGDA